MLYERPLFNLPEAEERSSAVRVNLSELETIINSPNREIVFGEKALVPDTPEQINASLRGTALHMASCITNAALLIRDRENWPFDPTKRSARGTIVRKYFPTITPYGSYVLGEILQSCQSDDPVDQAHGAFKLYLNEQGRYFEDGSRYSKDMLKQIWFGENIQSKSHRFIDDTAHNFFNNESPRQSDAVMFEVLMIPKFSGAHDINLQIPMAIDRFEVSKGSDGVCLFDLKTGKLDKLNRVSNKIQAMLMIVAAQAYAERYVDRGPNLLEIRQPHPDLDIPPRLRSISIKQHPESTFTYFSTNLENGSFESLTRETKDDDEAEAIEVLEATSEKINENKPLIKKYLKRRKESRGWSMPKPVFGRKSL